MLCDMGSLMAQGALTPEDSQKVAGEFHNAALLRRRLIVKTNPRASLSQRGANGAGSRSPRR